MLTVACVLFDGKGGGLPHFSNDRYSPGWVDRLARGARRHTDRPVRVVCLTDREYDFEEDIEPIRLNAPGTGWLSCMELFRPEVTRFGPTLSVGLDTVFMGDLMPLFGLVEHHDFVLPLDPFHAPEVCNGLMLTTPLGADAVWRSWLNGEPDPEKCTMFGVPSEMVWLREARKRGLISVGVLDEHLPGCALSYKVHIMRGGRSPEGASVVYFHGNPKQSDLGTTDPVRIAWEKEG